VKAEYDAGGSKQAGVKGRLKTAGIEPVHVIYWCHFKGSHHITITTLCGGNTFGSPKRVPGSIKSNSRSTDCAHTYLLRVQAISSVKRSDRTIKDFTIAMTLIQIIVRRRDFDSSGKVIHIIPGVGSVCIDEYISAIMSLVNVVSMRQDMDGGGAPVDPVPGIRSAAVFPYIAVGVALIEMATATDDLHRKRIVIHFVPSQWRARVNEDCPIGVTLIETSARGDDVNGVTVRI